MSTLSPSLNKLTEQNDLSSFICGAQEIDEWLRKRAWKGQIVGNANVFVYEHNGEVLGVYALATGGVEHVSARGQRARTHPIQYRCCCWPDLAFTTRRRVAA